MTGAQIVGMLEIGLSSYPEPNGAFMQVSAIHVEFDSSRKARERVVKVTIDADPELSFDAFKERAFVVAMPSVMGYLEKLGTDEFLEGCERLVDEEYAVFVQEPVWDFVATAGVLQYPPNAARNRIKDVA